MQTLQSHDPSRRGSSSKRAFTFTELLVVVGVLGFLFLVLIPAQADSRTKSKGVRCLDNLRQIMGALMLYTQDNHDLFPPNPDDGNTLVGHNWCPGGAGRGQAAEFNSDLIASRSPIMSYINTNVSLFLCTADLRVGFYQGTDLTKIGTRVPAARSIAMNQAVGTICPGFNSGSGHAGKPTLSVNGRWLDGTFSHHRNTPYRTYGKLAEVIVPGPSRLWVITEEDPYSINDGTLAHDVAIPEWIDFPSTQHGMSCVLGFADGHVELHKWTDARTPVVAGNVSRRAVPNSADWTWLSDRTTALAQ